MSKNKTLAIVAAVAAFAAVSASAASLGGLTGTSLGADLSVVASCDANGIAVTYTTGYNVATSQYIVSAVNLTGVDPSCGTKVANLTLSDSGGVALGTTAVPSLTVTAGAATIPVAGTVSAKAITGLALVISG
jgi:hypothetical protein